MLLLTLIFIKLILEKIISFPVLTTLFPNDLFINLDFKNHCEKCYVSFYFSDATLEQFHAKEY